jgi:CHAT domain-containing protein/Tfp pilus assembly protein PilF
MTPSLTSDFTRFSQVILSRYCRHTHQSWQVLLGCSVLLLSSPLATLATTPSASLPPSLVANTQPTEADRIFNEGVKLFQTGTPDALRQALQTWQKALQLYQQAGNTAKEAETLTGLGVVYNQLGDKQKALETYQQALSIYQKTNDQTWIADTLNSIGLVHADLGEYEPALAAYNQALPLYEAVKDIGGKAYTLNNLGVAYDAQGEYQKALDAYNEALPLWQQVGDKKGQAYTLNNIGYIYDTLGQFQQALASYNAALPLWREVKDRQGEAFTLNNIGLAYANAEQYDKALEYYNQALPLWQELLGSRGQATTLNNIGYVYANTGNFNKALQTYNQALPLWERVGDRRGEASTLNNIGFVYANLNEIQPALNYYNRALELRRSVGDRAKEALTLYRIAISQRDLGNLEAAQWNIEAALEIVEDLRTKVDNQDFRASFFASKQDYYEFYIDLLMQMHKSNPTQGYDAKALQASERARARSLLDILTDAGAEIRQGVDPELSAQEKALQQKLAGLEERRTQVLAEDHTEEQAAAINSEIEQVLQDYRQVQAQIRETSPRYAALTQPQPLTLQDIQQQVLDKDTVLLEYSLGKERSYLWIVTSDSLKSYELPARDQIEKASLDFRNWLTVPSLRIRSAQMNASAQNLSEMILGPIAEQLGNKRLLIVSDGALQYVPFAALAVPAQPEYTPLIVNHELVTLPSASTVGVLRQELAGRPSAPKTLAVLADPVFSQTDERVNQVSAVKPPAPQDTVKNLELTFQRLPFTKQEAEKILDLVPASEKAKAFGFAANREAATSEVLSNYQMVHFATHGILDSANPELSGLVLSLVDKKGRPQDGFLRLPEIFNLNLPAELVVLSACETGLGQQIRGEGLVGLTRGFMYAGAARVVVSLWSVDDEATSLLMVNFYQRMLQQGLKPAAALRAAQLEMWQSEWKSPAYWAAFTMQGEWR